MEDVKKVLGWIAILAAIIIVFSTPYYVAKVWWPNKAFNEHTAHIGDTLGGIIGPMISALSAILVFIAFREQVKANSLVQKHFAYDSYSKELDNLEEYIDELESTLFSRNYDGDTLRLKEHSADSVQLRAWSYRLSLMQDLALEVGECDNQALKKRVQKFQESRFTPLMIHLNDKIPNRVDDEILAQWKEAFDAYARDIKKSANQN